MQEKDWQNLLKEVYELQQWFPEGIAFIGGIAVYAHSKAKQEVAEFAAMSHVADFMVSKTDFVDLRDIVALTPNRRLGKQQFEQGGFEFDVYVEGQTDLVVPVDEVVANSEVRSGLRVASLEHLLVLKTKALLDRKGTAKGNKDEDDLVRILLTMDDVEPNQLERLTPEMSSAIASAVKGDSCMRLANGNSHQAKQIRLKAQTAYEAVAFACKPKGDLGGWTP